MPILMIIENEINTDFPSHDKGLNGLKGRLMPILKMASDICETTTSLIYMHEDSDIRILASNGINKEPVVTAVKKISGMLDLDEGLSIIQNVRDHKRVTTLLSDLEIDNVQFYAGVPIRNESGTKIGALCICDSNPRNLLDVQKNNLGVMAGAAEAHIMLFKEKELSNKNSRELKIKSAFLNNSTELTFLLEPNFGNIRDVSYDVEKVLGYSPDVLRGKSFTEIAELNGVVVDTIEQWFLTGNLQKGHYSTSVRLIDHQNRKRWFQCEFSADKNHWYVTARDINKKKVAQQGVRDLKVKLKKVVSVAKDLIYKLDWASGNLSWGDELTDVLGYPHTEKFVDYDWWIDKIHPEDLERVIRDVAQTVEGESQKAKLVYRIRTFDGPYKYVMNRIYVDRHEDGTPKNIIGAIVDVTEVVKLEEQSRRNEKSLEEKETLLAEVHHRVKNNLAMVSGMLQLQIYTETDERVQQKLIASTERIQTMATIHELLYNSSSFENLRIDENIEKIISSLVSTYEESLDMHVSFDMEPVKLNINEALPCSLIVNEVITNVLKYAFSDGGTGLLDISLIEEDETVTLKIRDDGKGLPDDFDPEGNGSSLGMELIQTLTKQLKGENLYTSLDRGVEFMLAFDKSNEKDVGFILE
ncbi:hypothetical protein DYD21_08820 [Rhodohalobacter sp. SW132]|uniref:sensor histidine kinase n=1 Tax=Rhodohalobacter sp. SW132 TaxID=2293433 RepID=UPI000E24E347|nr:sensor histidine kinase [Rhodohalobacter sp. SW132]REL37871.1 hypothetical protein DYD21_08820 [Rhodohalobacter sp. SW132]